MGGEGSRRPQGAHEGTGLSGAGGAHLVDPLELAVLGVEGALLQADELEREARAALLQAGDHRGLRVHPALAALPLLKDVPAPHPPTLRPQHTAHHGRPASLGLGKPA